MSWQREKRSILEMREFAGKEVPHVVGWVGVRDCGCGYTEGMRLDLHEVTFGAFSCPEHEAEVSRAMEQVTTMPGSDETMCLLWERLLDAEISPQIH